MLRMLICSVNDGIYEGSLLVMNKEIEGKEVVELIQMVTTLMRIDILIEEVPTTKANTMDYNTVYKMLEEEGNLMLHGSLWRARAMETIKQIFMTIMTGGKIVETYEAHRSLLKKFIEENMCTERQEFIKIGWVETYEKNVKIQIKMTKRTSDFIRQRMEIFKTKVNIVKKCQKKYELG